VLEEKSNVPPELLISRALPAVLLSRKSTSPPDLLVIVASPAVLKSWNRRTWLLVNVALPPLTAMPALLNVKLLLLVKL
jgi:hypothetical protein